MRCWVYHETEEPKVVDYSEREEYYANGWADTPAKFANIADFGVDADDELGVQVVGEAIEGVKDMANGALNIDEMGKDDLKEYAKKHFAVDIDKRSRVKKMRDQVKELIDGDGS
jgi:hypothetical protein